MDKMPERIWAGVHGRHSTVPLLKKPIATLGISADVEYVRADLSQKQSDLLTLGILQEKNKVAALKKKVKAQKAYIEKIEKLM